MARYNSDEIHIGFSLAPYFCRDVKNRYFDTMTKLFLSRGTAIYFFCCVAFFGCDYQPGKEFFLQVPQPNLNDVIVSIAGVTTDTIYNYTTTGYTFSISSRAKTVTATKVTFNATTVGAGGSANGSFNVSPTGLASGYYTLRIDFTLTAATNSLASAAGQEFISGHKDWVVKIDQDAPQPVPITSIVNQNGTIKISWTPYTKSDFQQYQLNKYVFDNNGAIQDVIHYAPITNQSTSSTTDGDYLGGKVQYFLSVTAADHTSTSSSLYDIGFKPNIKYSFQPSGIVTVSWNSLSKLKNNLSYYLVRVQTESQHNFQVYNSTDTVITINPVDFFVGDIGNISLTAYPTVSTNYELTYQSTMISGDPFPVFNSYTAMDFYNRNYYAVHQSTLYKIDQSGAKIDSLVGCTSFHISDNGIMAGIVNSSLYYIDPSSLSLQSKVNYALPRYPVVTAVSNNSRLGIYDYDLFGHMYWLTPNGTPITDYIDYAFQTDDQNSLSPSGMLAKISTEIFQYNGSAYSSLGYLDGNGFINGDFSPFDSTVYYAFYSNKINVVEPHTLTVNTSYPQQIVYCNIDKAGGKIGCQTSGGFTAFDLSFNVVKSVRVSSQTKAYLLNNTIICASGVQISLSSLP